MNAISISNETSIVLHALLGSTDRTLCTAMDALELQAILFARIEPLLAGGDNIVSLVRFGHQATSDAVIDCRGHASEDDILGVVDCLERVVGGHRAAKNLLSALAELSDAEVANLARLGVDLSSSVLRDLGCEA
jgi:hypothetical protein